MAQIAIDSLYKTINFISTNNFLQPIYYITFSTLIQITFASFFNFSIN